MLILTLQRPPKNWLEPTDADTTAVVTMDATIATMTTATTAITMTVMTATMMTAMTVMMDVDATKLWATGE